jgi:hypothetical protein
MNNHKILDGFRKLEINREKIYTYNTSYDNDLRQQSYQRLQFFFFFLRNGYLIWY